MDFSPIILFVYNRPWHTEQTINALKKNELASQSDLIVFSDGPKTAKDNDSVTSVRNCLKNIRGFKTITVIERSNNWGLAANIIDGVTETVNKYGKVIVLEDDLVTSPVFLSFMNQALEHFRDTEKVMQISGYMFDVNIEDESNAVFLPTISSWGWATWKRAWKHFDPTMSGYEKLSGDKKLQYKFSLEGTYDYWSMLENQIKNKIDSWAIRWYLSVFMMHGLTLYPVKTLVKNIGFDGSGTHSGNSSIFNSSIFDEESRVHEFHFPSSAIKREAYDAVKYYLSSKQTIRSKLSAKFLKIRRLIKI